MFFSGQSLGRPLIPIPPPPHPTLLRVCVCVCVGGGGVIIKPYVVGKRGQYPIQRKEINHVSAGEVTRTVAVIIKQPTSGKTLPV